MMEFKTVVFYVFSTILVLASLRVVTLRNPVHAALHLVLAFFSASGIWVLLQAEFLAIALVLVYVGAVMVLFLFVVMLLDINLDRMREGFWSYLPVASIVALFMLAEISLILVGTFYGWLESDLPNPVNVNNTQELGRVLFTNYVYPFELASLILLVGVVAAVALTLRNRRKSKSVSPSEQVFVKAQDRVRVIKMPSDTSMS